MTTKVCTMNEALDLIKTGDIMACSGFGMAAMAEEVLLKLEERFLKTGQPRDLTQYTGSGLSDGSGHAGSDHLAHEGLLKRIVAGHFGTCLKMCDFILADKTEAYNLPQGVIMRLYRASLCNQPGYITKVGLNTFVDSRLEGGKLNSKTTADIVEVIEIKGDEYLFYHAPRFNIGIIRGTLADTEGNLSIDEEPVKTDIRLIAMMVKACGGHVIAQVKHVVAAGSLTADRVYVPGIYIDAVVQCSDPMKNHRMIGNINYYDPSLAGHAFAPENTSRQLQLDAKKVIARRCAMELCPDTVVNLGLGAPEYIAAVTAEEGVYNQLTLTAESGVIGGIPCGGKNFGATRNAVCMVEQECQFDFYDGAGLDITFLGFAEVNPKGDVNNSRFGPKLAGCGGAVNISQNTRKVVFCGTFTAGGLAESFGNGEMRILSEGQNKKFISSLQQTTYSGEFGAKNGQQVLYVTERAVFMLTKEGIMLVEIAPGMDLQKDIIDQMEFAPIIHPDLKRMDKVLFFDRPINLKPLFDKSKRPVETSPARD